MAYSRISLVFLVFVFVLGLFNCNVLGTEGRGYGDEGEQWGENPYILKKESHEKRLGTDSGEIRAVPIFRQSSTLARRLRNFELNCIHIKPKAFLLPHFTNADRLVIVLEGKAKVGFVHNGRLREDDLEVGTLHFIPKGSPFYAINNDQSHNLVLGSLLYNPDPYRQRHHDSFYVGGGRNPPTLLRAFSREILEAAFKTEWQRIQGVISKQEKGIITPLTREQNKKIEGGDDNVSPFWSWRSRQGESKEDDYKPFNLQKKKPTFSNQNGQYIEVNRNDFSPLDKRDERQEMGVSYTKIESGKMTAPFWNTDATKVAVVLRGHGRIQIAAPEGVTQQQRGGGEREREKRESEEDFKLSYTRVEEDLQPGDVFIIPANHPSVLVSASNERLEILSFLLNNERNNINFLAGKNSVLTQMKEEILAASFNVEEKEVAALTKAQKEEFFLDGPKHSREWSIL